MLKGKKIIIGITASIAAYKIPLLVRLLKKAGAEVKIIITPSAKDFVTPLTLSTLSGNPVLSELFDKQDGSWNSHVELGLWADLFLVAPASANTLSKMAHGAADNLLLTSYLSARSPVFIAPAMDLDMYKHPSTKQNIDLLRSFGHYIIEPTEGELASGLCGAGRMEEPEVMFDIIQDFFKKKTKLSGKKVLVSAGPTFEAIDPVRFIGNHSSGKMGFAIADELASRGAIVTLVSGPVNISSTHAHIKRIDVTTAEQMYDACIANFESMDIGIMAAAIADFTPKNVADRKIKKENATPVIELVSTKDVLKEMGRQKKDNQLLIGFALETNDEVANALKKLHKKNLDLIVLNSLQDPGAGFKHATNQVSLIDRNEHIQAFELKNKDDVARDIVNRIEELI
ncbi:MAG: bifunctional phosphopantothenoylcysteine decarboxylase/phosphopantothenate--cysteine ligase CoaBC [Bacteroidales bacterium]|nr:bifunctional phosphopantothenoylcysteine decarboxylase/phosphopantothenate--cysteine ligase CoaBC [Bacteroidales bacterium]